MTKVDYEVALRGLAAVLIKLRDRIEEDYGKNSYKYIRITDCIEILEELGEDDR